MARVHKLSVQQLKKLIAEEKAGLGQIRDVEKEPKKTKEVEADEYADTLEKDVDHYKGLKESEVKLEKKLAQVRQRRSRLAKKINEARKTKKKGAK